MDFARAWLADNGMADKNAMLIAGPHADAQDTNYIIEFLQPRRK